MRRLRRLAIAGLALFAIGVPGCYSGTLHGHGWLAVGSPSLRVGTMAFLAFTAFVISAAIGLGLVCLSIVLGVWRFKLRTLLLVVGLLSLLFAAWPRYLDPALNYVAGVEIKHGDLIMAYDVGSFIMVPLAQTASIGLVGALVVLLITLAWPMKRSAAD